MICSSEERFFTSNLLGVGNWTPNWGATQSPLQNPATPHEHRVCGVTAGAPIPHNWFISI
ncbi:hypothetical protein IXO1088_011565 [Xanthomonas oryzae pv. oryzae]|nr:hypothetical protein IXO1088_011565 [Xanthomonas oryzae pv. oryzae]